MKTENPIEDPESMIQQLPTATQTLPKLYRDTGFWGMIATQFLGAFNDNLYKQLVLFLCVDLAFQDRTQDYQGQATVIFALPFILFSGFAGFLSDRICKRRMIVYCKAAEVMIMLLATVAFAFGSLSALLVVLFLAGTHSAFFGPSKYGILPEMLRERDLPRANGIMAMTTFLAIIFGFSIAGLLKDLLSDDHLWMGSAVCILIAGIGLLTSFLVRKTPIAHPGLPFELSSIAVNSQTRRVLWSDRQLLSVLLISSVFWLVGGVVYPPAINALGKLQLFRMEGRADTLTGLLAACTGIGIAFGCLLAGRLSRGRVNSRLVRVGAWGMIASLVLLALPNFFGQSTVGPDSTLLGIWGARITLIGMGMFAGFFTVPLQVFLQVRAPEGQKGRIIGTMNLFNWIGIALAGVIYAYANDLFAWLEKMSGMDLPPCLMFAVAASMLLPVALFYRPPDVELV